MMGTPFPKTLLGRPQKKEKRAPLQANACSFFPVLCKTMFLNEEGWRTKGLAQQILAMPEMQTSFRLIFHMPELRGVHNLSGQVGVFLAPSLANLRRFFRSTFHAKSPKPVFGGFNGFPPDSRQLSICFDRFSGIFNQFQTASVNFNQFKSV